MNRSGFTGDGLQARSLAAAAKPQATPAEAREYPHRTQFDSQLLAESYDPLIVANHGRQMQESRRPH